MAIDDGELLQGQKYDERADFVVPFTEQMKYEENADAMVGNPRTDIEPHDAHASKVRIWGQPGVEDLCVRYAGTVNVNLPDVLTSLPVNFSVEEGEGYSTKDVGYMASYGTSGGISCNPQANTQASSSIMPDVQPIIKQTWGANTTCEHFSFYLPDNASQADILARMHQILGVAFTVVSANTITTVSPHGLVVGQRVIFLAGSTGGVTIGTPYYVRTGVTPTTFTVATTPTGGAVTIPNGSSGTVSPLVSTWPVFKPTPVTLTLKGVRLSLQNSAEAMFSIHWSGDNYSLAYSPYDNGVDPVTVMESSSVNKDITVKTVQIPPTLHAAITLPIHNQTLNLVITSTAKVPAYTGIITFDGMAETVTTDIDGESTVNPTSVAATVGYTDIPTKDLFIYDITCEPYRYNLVQVRVTLINFNVFA